MKITKQNNKKTLTLALTVFAVLLAASTTSAYYFKVGPFDSGMSDSINLEKPSANETTAGNQTKKQSLDQAESEKNITGSDPSPAPQPIEGSDKQTVNMEISAANQNSSSLQVRALIQAVVSTGECTLSMTGPNGATYAAVVGVQPNASSTTCKGFDIPLDQLVKGLWAINIDFNNSELTTSATKEIEIK